jgi:carbon-monoxide dehydrogenase large subunit
MPTGIGARQPRVEDDSLVRGAARFTSDIRVDGVLHAAFVRTTEAHARIVSIDATEARAAPGVVAVYTHEDLGLGPVFYPVFAEILSSQVFHRRPLASDRVRFVGEVLAIVVAESDAAAEDAVDLVWTEYESLPVVVDPVIAASNDAPLLFEEAGSNVAVRVPFEAGLRPAGPQVSVHATITNHRMAVAPLEGNAITVVPDPSGGRLTVFASTQMPHGLQKLTANFLGIGPGQLHVIAPAVGGGFGGKTPAEPEYVAIIAAARRLGRPLRWIQSRSENLMTMHARGHRFEVTLSATPDGDLTSLEVDALTDVGAYPGVGCGMIFTTRGLACGVYDIPHVRFDLACVATNTAPTGAFRGAGRPEAIGLVERSMDMLASELSIDPADLRRRNMISSERMPYHSLTGVVYDSGSYANALETALDEIGYEQLRADQARRRISGCAVHLGIGMCCYVEISANAPGFEDEYASVEITTEGRARIIAGTFAHGQGHHTIYAQILASELGIPIELVDFVQGDTDAVPRGAGTGGSRSAQIGGSAVKVAAEAVLEKARQLAAYRLEANPADIVVVQGGLAVNGVPESTQSWASLARLAQVPESLPDGMKPGLFADPGFSQVAQGTAPFGCHIAVVEVDGETGAVRLLKMLAVDDCGTIINPLLAEGQVHGGLLGGIGQALFEEVAFDELGNPQNANFATYGFPSAADLPAFETRHTVTPSPNNPLGAKGLGEGGTTGSFGAVHNAVVDAVAHLGVRHIETPLTPLNVWRAISANRAAGADGDATR